MSVNSFELVFANSRGHVFNYPGLLAAGMKAGRICNIAPDNWIKLPPNSELFMLPHRTAVGFDRATGEKIALRYDPYSEQEEIISPVAAFIPPGYTLTHSSAYEETPHATMLPLFAYGACAFYRGDFYVAALKVDADIRHDERFLDMNQITQNVSRYKKLFPSNRLIPHLAICATVNSCANAKNFFLGKFEAPIPTSPVCNAQCQGCISLQPQTRSIPSTQKRITFTPLPEEIAEIALFHFENEAEPILSFGQGCEGEPLLAASTIEKAIRLVRQKTSKGTINVNSNASRPEVLGSLFEAGLNNIRVSTNSVRERYYSYYYQPKGYSFKEVVESIDIAKKNGGFVSLNYLSMPGFTDSKEEFLAIKDFIATHQVDMIQWRNLNYDPIHYFKDLHLEKEALELVGMKEVITSLQKDFPKLRMGYFNPKKSDILK